MNISPIRQPLLIPDLMALRAKLRHPHPDLNEWVCRYRRQLSSEPLFHRDNLYLDVLLGDLQAIEQARRQVIDDAQSLEKRDSEDSVIEHHVWCVAPRAMRLAVYQDWLVNVGAMTTGERIKIAQSLLNFTRRHVVSVLRTRVPAADNQSWSMALSTAIIGLAFADLDPVGELAQQLHHFGMRRLFRLLRLLPRDGYLLEGSTYQTEVVSPLAMWTGALMASRYGPEALVRRFSPHAANLMDVLRVERKLSSPGALLLPWDHYGWQPKINLSPIAYVASLLGEDASEHLLDDVAQCWDRPGRIAWCGDDRMWALLYWPQKAMASSLSAPLQSWVMPNTAAAIDHHPSRSRLFLCWDRTADCLQAVGRMQVNPGHVTWEAHGRAMTADGMLRKSVTATEEEVNSLLETIEQRELIDSHDGSAERWASSVAPGLPLFANCVLPEGGERHLPFGVQGQLVDQWRCNEQHLVVTESKAFWQPRWNIQTLRRAIAVNSDGIAWIVDHARADSPLAFLWQMHLRSGVRINGNTLALTSPGGEAITLGWLPVSTSRLDAVDGFPASWGNGTENEAGCERLQLRMAGDCVLFAVCLLPWAVTNLTISGDEHMLHARWDGGDHVLNLPENWISQSLPDPMPDLPTINDLHHEPWVDGHQNDKDLLALLDEGRHDHWREIVAAMQTLTIRGRSWAMPRIHELLCDPTQPYQVHSVAAWCLGRARWTAAMPQLCRLAGSPEFNTAMRSRFALDALTRV